jgi:TonB family protein
MNAALLYHPPPRWQTWFALAGAVTLHLVAVAVARNHPMEGPRPTVCPFEVVADGTEAQPPQPADTEIEPPPVERTSTSEEVEAFPETLPPPRPRPKVRTAVPFAKTVGIGPGRSQSFGSIRGLALSAPRPEYPYEARRQRMTGTGVAVLTIDPRSGNVLDVRMSRSTGGAVLDNATVSGLRRWRFQPGGAASIYVPITFTLTGPVY